MSEYYIDFDGYCSIEANSKEEAEEKFWEAVNVPSSEEPMTCIKDFVYDIQCIEGPETEEDKKRRARWEEADLCSIEKDRWKELEAMMNEYFCTIFGDYVNYILPDRFTKGNVFSLISPDVLGYKTLAGRKLETQLRMMRYTGPYRAI